ncbi:Adenylate and Guanylate cyclase catalytic domain containing protein [Tritrichomonas foetus]|uniref:Adenylate and Guanylate cyclase catalytic domain containing protein n=1 Tax=Tritrichomonas foetus TaxID=1144522 RepID=A0A1J4JGC8_9EUKA|nr:Adenylate and Guanylate cyclase catalytic domain containing protein [Tritrichomonas foetus]|eukprot:OHS96509.1 Adenylate and Guanylate cyclase catalytic domain containing protein [Tritrichomonas foetus]
MAMLPVESSMMSHSQSEIVTIGSRKALITGTTSKIDSIFPIYDHVCQKTKFPVSVMTIFAVYFLFQTAVVSFWPQAPFWAKEQNNQVAYWLSQVFFLVPTNPTESYLTILFIVILASFLMATFFLLSCIFYYLKNFRFSDWTLYPVKVIFEMIALVFIIPCAAFTGAGFLNLYKNNTAISWVFLVFGVITTCGAVILMGLGYTLKSHSVYLQNYLLSSFDSRTIVGMNITSAVSIVLSYLFTIFPSWCQIILQLIHIALNILLFIDMRYLPFHFTISNAIFQSMFISAAVNDLILIITNFVDLPFYVPVIIFGFFFILLTVVFYFVNKKKIQSLLNKLRDVSDEEGEQEINDLFESLGLTKNEKKIVQAIRLAFMNISPRFLDFSLFRCLTQNHSSCYALGAALQLIAFFPGESRKMNLLFSAICQKRDHSIAHRFLIYQVYRVNTLRQSSVSSAANEKFNELRNLTNNCEKLVRSFFVCKNPTISIFEQIAYQNNKVRALWEEGISDYPNNSKFYEDFAHFLIDCPAEFHDGILQKHRSDMIDAGHNFAKDYCYRSMVASYPDYIKKGKIDLRGIIKANVSNRKGSMSSASSNSRENSSTTSSFGEIDQEVEDTMGKMLLRQSKMRLALHHSIKDRKLNSTKFIPYSITFALLAFIIALVVIFMYLKTSFVERKTSMDRLSYISKVRFYMALSDDCIFMRFVNETGRFKSIPQLQHFAIEDANQGLEPYMNFNGDFAIEIMYYMNECRKYYGSLLKDVSYLASQDYDVYAMAAPLFENVLNITICYNGDYLQPQPSNLKNVVVLALFAMAQMSSYQDFVTWYNSSTYCEVIKNWDMTMVGSGLTFSSLTDDQNKRFLALQKNLKIMMIAIPVGMEIITFVPSFIATLLFINKIKSIAEVLSKMDNKVKQDAMKSIRPTMSDDDNLETTEIPPKTARIVIVLICFFFMTVITSLFTFIMVFYSDTVNENINILNGWQYYACNRLSLSCECFHMIITAPVLNDSIHIDFMSQQSEVDLGSDWMRQLDDMNEGLLQGAADSPPCFGYDEELDRLNLQEACSLDDNDTGIHDMYRCSSANQGIAAFRDFVVEICRDPNAFNGTIDADTPLNFLHLSNTHLWRRLEDCINRILDLAVIEYDTMVSNEMLFLIFGIILAFATFFVGFYLYQVMIIETTGAMSIIKRVHPLDIVNNKKLMDIILNRDSMQKEQGMTIDQSVIHNSFNSIVCTSINGVIEIVNQAITNLLGYTPEQLLGQQPATLFKQDDGEKITKQMQLMIEKQSPPVYEDHLICITDAALEIPCQITILAMVNSNSDVTSFVLIISDEAALIKQQKDAEEAKAQSENLLFQILPRDIVTKLNSGEKDISFTVPSASIIFIDIVKFSEYSTMLTPQEIMGNLSLIFAAFDNIIKKYNLITKIKLIGDVYMAAAGLFSPDEKPQAHAEQTVRFGLDALTELEDVNVRLNANLNIRIGVNSGGPLLAGVLGTDKPVFDIIGDPINVAARLQSTDVPGKVQIPQSTYDLIQDLDFFTEPRGEVYLKGKGQTTAYFVTTMSVLGAFQTMSQSDEIAKKNEE